VDVVLYPNSTAGADVLAGTYDGSNAYQSRRSSYYGSKSQHSNACDFCSCVQHSTALLAEALTAIMFVRPHPVGSSAGSLYVLCSVGRASHNCSRLGALSLVANPCLCSVRSARVHVATIFAKRKLLLWRTRQPRGARHAGSHVASLSE